jgi:hypothetical protein
MVKFPTYVLNLDHEKKRWIECSKNLRAKRFVGKITRWSANERKPEDFEPKKPDHGAYTKRIRAFYIAHSHSVLDILKHAQSKNQEYILFIEDDCYIYRQNEVVAGVNPIVLVNHMFSKARNDPRWDMIALGSYGVSNFRRVQGIPNVLSLWHDQSNEKYFKGSHAMIFRVKNMIPIVERCIEAELALDIYFGIQAKSNLNKCSLLLLIPYIARQRNILSNIVENEDGSKRHVFQSYDARRLEAQLFSWFFNLENELYCGPGCQRVYDWDLPYPTQPIIEPFSTKEPCPCVFCQELDWNQKAIDDYDRDSKDFGLKQDA